MPTYPKDRFDERPDDLLRVGAHRAAAKKGRGWIGFGWAALATVVLVVAGLTALSLATDNVNFDLPFFSSSDTPTPTPTPTTTAAPKVDPALAISILNGTPTQGLANQIGDALVTQGWNGAAVGVGSRANAASNNIATTTVFYSDPVNEGAARVLVLALKVGQIRLANNYPGSPITVLIGLDYRPGG